MIDPHPDRPEPRGCTLGDLMALTLGAAVAASLEWFGAGANSNLVGTTRLAPGWYTFANQGVELMEKTSLSLVPVILARRMRFGGPLRPVESMPMLTGAMLVSLSMSRWPAFGLFYRSSNPPHLLHVHPEAYHLWELSEMAVGALAALVVLIRRRRPPDWIGAVSLAIAWQLLTTWLGYFYQEWANQRLMTLPAPIYVAVGSTFLVQWPQQVVFHLPMMIAILDLVGPKRARWTWVVWAAVVIALPMPALYEARNLAKMYLDPGHNLFDALRLVGKALALAASFGLARWTEPAWRRFLGGATVNEGLETR